MQIILNEKGIDIQVQTSLHAILEQYNFSTQKGIAVAVNNAVVPRSEWQAHLLQENDKILVITATKGG
ncbi:MAG: sulfur carrier protein ThiS [Paludibacteraceae bacterium]|nr:sulfur carrier protein ThiS [Paludibacteraceae bacterium]